MTSDQPSAVDALVRRWSLELGPPYPRGAVATWIAPARGPHGETLVLKLGPRHEEARDEPDALRIWDGDGAVRLVDAVVVDDLNGLLLERCSPGTPLAAAMDGPGQDVVVAGLLRRLWRPPPAGHGLRTLQSMCAWWADAFEQRTATHGTGSSGLDAGLARAGIALFRELPQETSDETVLATDLHAGNVLAAQREPWLVIDPKPYVGDRTYDALQHMLNAPDRLRAAPHAFVERMADLLHLDASRLQLWLFARCVQESHHQPFLADVAAAIAP